MFDQNKQLKSRIKGISELRDHEIKLSAGVKVIKPYFIPLEESDIFAFGIVYPKGFYSPHCIPRISFVLGLDWEK